MLALTCLELLTWKDKHPLVTLVELGPTSPQNPTADNFGAASPRCVPWCHLCCLDLFHPNLPQPGAQPVPELEEWWDLVLQGQQQGAHLGVSEARTSLVAPTPAVTHPGGTHFTPNTLSIHPRPLSLTLSTKNAGATTPGWKKRKGVGWPPWWLPSYLLQEVHLEGKTWHPQSCATLAWGSRCPQVLGRITSPNTKLWPQSPHYP